MVYSARSEEFSPTETCQVPCLLVIQAEAKAKPLCSPMADSSSDEDERPVRAAPTSFLSGPELLPSLIIDDSEAAPVRQSSRVGAGREREVALVRVGGSARDASVAR